MTLQLSSGWYVGRETRVRGRTFHILSLSSVNCFVVGLVQPCCLGESVLPQSTLMAKLTSGVHVQQFSAGERVLESFA